MFRVQGAFFERFCGPGAALDEAQLHGANLEGVKLTASSAKQGNFDHVCLRGTGVANGISFGTALENVFVVTHLGTYINK